MPEFRQLTSHSIYGGTRGYDSSEARDEDIKSLRKQGYDYFVDYRDAKAPIALNYGVRGQNIVIKNEDGGVLARIEVNCNRVRVRETNGVKAEVS